MGRMKGKQIENNSLDLEKIRSGSKLLPNDSTLGTEKEVSEITNSKEFVSKEYVDGAITDSAVSAGNGLSFLSNVVKLGGSLIETTTVNGDFDLTLQNKSFNLLNTIEAFNVGGSGFNGAILRCVIQSDGKIVVSGEFTSFNGADCSDYLVRLNSDGTLDTTFNSGSGFNGSLREIKLQSDGKIIVAGGFTFYNGTDCPDRLVRLNTDGTLDTTFNNGGSGFNSSVRSINIQSDGKILAGGTFTSYNGTDCPDRLVRLNTDGTLDATFNSGGSGFPSTIFNIELQSDGKILAGGNFTNYNGVDCSDKLIRLNTDGTLDTTFNNGGIGFGGDNVFSVKIQSDGKLVVGGSFISYNGVGPFYLVRLNSDGTLDTTFNNGGSGFNDTIFTVELQSDGKILAGGYFTSYNGVDCSDKLIRLNTDGTLDTTFNSVGSGFSSEFVHETKIQYDGKIIVGGDFISYNGINCSTNLVRLNSDGTLDNTDIEFKVYLDSNAGVLRYENDYSDYFTNRSLVDKEYVDSIISSSSLNESILLENTGFGVSGTSGFVSYLGTFTFPSDAVSDANVFVNGVKISISDYYFGTIGDYKPSTSDTTVYFNITTMGYTIETDDLIVIEYLS